MMARKTVSSLQPKILLPKEKLPHVAPVAASKDSDVWQARIKYLEKKTAELGREVAESKIENEKLWIKMGEKDKEAKKMKETISRMEGQIEIMIRMLRNRGFGSDDVTDVGENDGDSDDDDDGNGDGNGDGTGDGNGDGTGDGNGDGNDNVSGAKEADKNKDDPLNDQSGGAEEREVGSSSVPEAELGKYAHEGTSTTPHASSIPVSTVQVEEGEIPAIDPIYIDLSQKPAEPSRAPLDDVEEVEVDFSFENESIVGDSDLDELFKEIDENAEYSKNNFVLDDGTVLPGFESVFDTEVELVQSNVGVSSEAASLDESKIVDRFTSDAPQTSGRYMTREEIQICFKSRAKDLLDQKIPVKGRFHEEIPCMPAGLTGPQMKAFARRFPERFSDEIRNHPDMIDYVKVDLIEKRRQHRLKKKLPILITRNSSPIKAWWFDPIRRQIAIKRLNGSIQYVSSHHDLKTTFPEYELIALSKLHFHNRENNSFAQNVVDSVIRDVRSGFKDGESLKGKKLVVKNKIDPETNQPWVYTYYPPPTVSKEVRIKTREPQGALIHMFEWRYEFDHVVRIQRTDLPAIIISDPMDVCAFHVDDLRRLAARQIRVFGEDNEAFAKDFQNAVLLGIVTHDPNTGYVSSGMRS